MLMQANRMTEDRLDFHLWNWANWQRASFVGSVRSLWYPGDSPAIGISHSTTFDDLCAESDARCAAAVEAALDDCTIAERSAVHHLHLHAVYRPRIGLDAAYASARTRIGNGLDARGIL